MKKYKRQGYGHRFLCLAMSESYISSHFAEITNHGSEIEKRIDDSYCTKEWFTEENEKFMNGFRGAAEQVVVIDDDYESTIRSLLYTNEASYKTAEAIGMHFDKEYPDEANKITYVSVIHRTETGI